MYHKNRLFNFHFKARIIENTMKVKILPNIRRKREIEKSSFVYIAFFATMFVCLVQNTRRHAKLCSATLNVYFVFFPQGNLEEPT